VADWIDPRNHTPEDVFERQSAFLARHRNVLSMTELVNALQKGRSLPAGSVVITFDDGYLDHLTVAAPILARYGLPATVYLPTGYIERGSSQWIDRLYAAFRTRTSDRLAIETITQTYDLRELSQRVMAYRDVAALLMRANEPVREGLLSDVVQQLAPVIPPPRLAMTWADVHALQRVCPLVAIGAHTRMHLDMSAQTEASAREEVEGCVTDLERELGKRPAHFAFPYNRSTDCTSWLMEACGFRSAVTSGPACMIRADANPFALPRIAAPRSMTLLRFVTSGAYPDLPQALVGRC